MKNLKPTSTVLCGIFGVFSGLGLWGQVAVAQIPARAAKFEAECPEEIKTNQAPATTLKGWIPHVDTVNARQIFTGLVLHDGHPKHNTPLFPEESAVATAAEGSAATSDVIYKMPSGRETYLSCQYTNSIVRFTKKIPAGVTSCRVRFSETLGHVQKVLCD